jgi:hypothetical protein
MVARNGNGLADDDQPEAFEQPIDQEEELSCQSCAAAELA